jgi:hypothetical protein
LAQQYLTPLPRQAAGSSSSAATNGLNHLPAPAVFPAGAKMAVISGDPSKAELFLIELSLPDGYKIPKPMEKGAKGTVPANMHHFGIARGATIVAVSARGPFALTYVNPADDPLKRGGKP